MNIEPLSVDHLRRIRPQKAQVGSVDLHEISLAHSAYAVVHRDEVLMVFGKRRLANPTVAGHQDLLWAVLSEFANRHMVALTRIGRRVAEFHTGVLWMAVDEGFLPGERWANMLGFERVPSSGQEHTYYRKVC